MRRWPSLLFLLSAWTPVLVLPPMSTDPQWAVRGNQGKRIALSVTRDATDLKPGVDTTAPLADRWSADHHMHLASVDLCRRVGECLETNSPAAVYAADAVHALAEAGVDRGVILSCAYLYGLASLKLSASEVARLIRLENEFTAAEVVKYPGRLVGFLSVDPLQESAIAEIQHWRDSRVLIGLKLHFSASAVDLHRPAHRTQVARVVRAAAAQHLPMVIHVGGGAFGAAEAELFIRTILPSAGDSWVQIAHAAGGLPLEGENHLRVLRTFADHLVRNDPVTRHLAFDLSYVPAPEESPGAVAAIVGEMRRIGLSRFFFGSDFNVLTPLGAIKGLRRLGLSAPEWHALTATCAPWACQPGRSPD